MTNRKKSNEAKNKIRQVLNNRNAGDAADIVMEYAIDVKPEYSEYVSKKVSLKAAINNFINALIGLAVSALVGYLTDLGFSTEVSMELTILLIPVVTGIIAKVRKKIKNFKAYA